MSNVIAFPGRTQTTWGLVWHEMAAELRSNGATAQELVTLEPTMRRHWDALPGLKTVSIPVQFEPPLTDEQLATLEAGVADLAASGGEQFAGVRLTAIGRLAGLEIRLMRAGG